MTVLSAMLTGIGGVMSTQYISYMTPNILSGIRVSLRIVFAVILRRMYAF
jgi:ABC-type branched-subunit amino acid transport system permease subunit